MTSMSPPNHADHENHVSWQLIALPASVGIVRTHTATTLRKWGLDDLIDDATLVVSELVTNAASPKAAYGQEVTFALTHRPPDHVLIEVTDPGPGRPQLRHAADTDINGRGLLIVQALSADFGYRNNPQGGKTVWCLLSTNPAPRPMPHRR